MGDGGNGKVVLGIHSQVGPQTEGSVNQLIDGHAWISVTRGGRTEYYGLWPDTHPRGLDNGAASDIRRGIEGEPGFNPVASRYYELTPEQTMALEARLGGNVTWGYTNTCASWASETASRVTGQNISASELLGITDTPRALIDSIRALEQRRRTSPDNPITPAEVPRRSSSFGALEPGRTGMPQGPMFQQAEAAIRTERTRLNLPDDDISGQVAYVARVAGENNLPGIRAVRFPDEPRGNGTLWIQGSGSDPGARAQASYREFVETPVAASLAAIADHQAAHHRLAEASQPAIDAEPIQPRTQTA